MKGELTGAQRRVLVFLAGYNHERHGALTGPEIGASLGYRKSGTASDYLYLLAKRGLAERLGYGPNGGRTWKITEAGRAALATTPSGEGQ